MSSIDVALSEIEQDWADIIIQIDEKKLALETFNLRYADFMDKLVKKIVNEEIVDTIKWKMKMHSFSTKIIDTVRLVDVRIHGTEVEGYIVCDYMARGKAPDYGEFDVAKAREEGTKRHWVEPKIMKQQPIMINYTTGQIIARSTLMNQPNLPKALHWNANGTHYFSKGHWVSGMPSLRLIKRTVKEKRRIVKERIKDETKAFLKDLLS